MVPFEMARLYEPKHPRSRASIPSGRCRCWSTAISRSSIRRRSSNISRILKPEPALWPRDIAGAGAGAPARAQVRRGLFPADRPPDGPAGDARRSGRGREPRSRGAVLSTRWRSDSATRDCLAGAYSYADIAFYMAQLFGARMGAGMSDDDAEPPALARSRWGASGGAGRWSGRWRNFSWPRDARCRISCSPSPRRKRKLSQNFLGSARFLRAVVCDEEFP